MRKFIIVLILIIFNFQLLASEFIVESFEKAPNDLSVHMYPKKDINNNYCAIIKIKTDLTGLKFDSNLGIEGDVKKQPGEYWLYVSPHEQQLRINKEGFIPLYYTIPILIESSSVYVMLLTYQMKEELVKANKIGVILLESNPTGADVLIKGEKQFQVTPYQAVLKEGKYSFTLKKELFNDYNGDFEITANKTTILKLQLTPYHVEITELTQHNGTIDNSSIPSKPPILSILPESLVFKDSDGNNCIDGGENASISFTVKNTGYGDATGLKVLLSTTNNIQGLNYPLNTSIENIAINKQMSISIPVSGSLNTIDGIVEFNIKIDEPHGFGSDVVQLQVNTRAFNPPLVRVTDYSVTCEKSGTLQKKLPFELQVLIQNTNYGIAEDVNIDLNLTDDNIYCLSSNQNSIINSLNPGETVDIVYTLVATENYNSNTIPVLIKLSEKYQKFAENKSIVLSLNQKLTPKKIIVESKIIENTEKINIASLSSDVDKDIPVNQKKGNRIALIIGNEDYSSYQTGLNSESDVHYAINDATIFKEYALNTLGVKVENLYFISNATASIMKRRIELVTKILDKLGEKGELIFYYSGHGYPDEKNREPYLIPVDVSATNLNMAIKLADVFQQFSVTDASRITVFLDACFSGGGREVGLLAARGVKIKPKEEPINGNLVVFSASTGEQTALPFHNKKHGMFTYFLLKAIQETKGNITYKKLSDYLVNNISLESLRINQKEQDPQVIMSLDVLEHWMDWNLIK
ncbi:caspase family protein [Bacteroidota bacterium]